jgi:hypothetical protein
VLTRRVTGNPWESLSEYSRHIMRFLLLVAFATILMTGPAVAAPPTEPADQAMASLTREVAALFKDPASVRLTDVVVYDADLGRRVVCGNVNARNDDGSYTGFRPFRILSGPGGRISNPPSFIVGNDGFTVRRLSLMCGSDRLNDHH